MPVLRALGGTVLRPRQPCRTRCCVGRRSVARVRGVTAVRRAAALLVATALLAGPSAAATEPEPEPAIDVPAVLRALDREQVVRLPGSVAQFDEARVLPELPRSGRIVVVPPFEGTEGEHYDAVYGPLADALLERRFGGEGEDYDLVLVTGSLVQVFGEGTFQAGLSEAQRSLAHRDVTEGLRFAARRLAAREPNDDSEPDLAEVPPDPALVEQVVAGLRASRVWTAPGVRDRRTTDAELRELSPDVPVRVAQLPVLDRTEPYPDLLPALAAAFPGELVVLQRGSWLEASADVPEAQREVDSARNYVLGAFGSFLERGDQPPRAVLRLFLERFQEVRYGQAFRRPPVEPVPGSELLRRWAPRVAWATVAVLALLGLRTVRRSRREHRQQQDRARSALTVGLVARLARLSERVAADDLPPAVAADVAERTATARELFEQGRSQADAEVLAAAVEAVEQAEAALR